MTDIIDQDEPAAQSQLTNREPNPIGLSTEQDRSVDHMVGGPPRHIPGGFSGLAEDLDRRSRDWTMMVRLLDQQRLQLQTSEHEGERLNAELEALLPTVRESSHALRTAMEATIAGDVSSNLSSLFASNLRSLDRLENVAKALTANLLWTRSSWEQYARSVIGAQKMREDLKV